MIKEERNLHCMLQKKHSKLQAAWVKHVTFNYEALSPLGISILSDITSFSSFYWSLGKWRWLSSFGRRDIVMIDACSSNSYVIIWILMVVNAFLFSTKYREAWITWYLLKTPLVNLILLINDLHQQDVSFLYNGGCFLCGSDPVVGVGEPTS